MLRLVVLGGVLAVLAVLLAPALRSYLAQQQQISALRAQVSEQRAQVRGLEQERAAWDDPAYVKAQARDRLKFVMPGERAYTVIDPAPDPATTAAAASPARAAAGTARGDRSWFGDVWRSMEIAGAGESAPAAGR
jgi:cell division protein FtsB